MKHQQVTALIDAHRTFDEERFRSMVLQIVATERNANRAASADAIELALTRPIRNTAFALDHVARIAGTQAPPFVRVSVPKATLDGLVLEPACRAALDAFLREHARADELVKHGLAPTSRLLFHGPPGNGKTKATKAAEALATALALPFHYVTIDGLVGKFLGETSANLRKAFDFASAHRGVLFFDELDPPEGGGRPIVIAATNAEHMIDRAVWRRFDLAVEFDNPDEAMVTQYLRRSFAGTITLAEVELPWRDNFAQSAGNDVSMAGLERAVNLAQKSAVLDGRTKVAARELNAAIVQCKDRVSG